MPDKVNSPLTVRDCKEVVISADKYQKLLNRIEDIDAREKQLEDLTEELDKGKVFYMTKRGRELSLKSALYHQRSHGLGVTQVMLTESKVIKEMAQETVELSAQFEKVMKELLILKTQAEQARRSYERKEDKFNCTFGELSRREAIKLWKYARDY